MGVINIGVVAAKLLSIPFFALLYEYRFVDVDKNHGGILILWDKMFGTDPL